MNLRAKLPWALGIAAFISWGAWYGHQNACGSFPDWQSSLYVLPYPVGSTYYVNQSNCTNGGHQGPYKYSYDFVMPIGTTVTAARAGVVTDIRVKFRDGQHGVGQANWVKIRHADGTIAAYSHLTQGGALVKVGDPVVAGQPIGLSGNTGDTGRLPHLHFHLGPCLEPVDCGTLPVSFRNTDPNPDGLDGKRHYRALPYDKNDAQPRDRQRQRSEAKARKDMTLKRMDNVLIVVDDLEAAKAFFIELGLKLEGETTVEGPLVGSLIGLKDVRATLAMMRTPDGQGIELDKFHTPNAIRFGPVDAPVNTGSLAKCSTRTRTG